MSSKHSENIRSTLQVLYYIWDIFQVEKGSIGEKYFLKHFNIGTAKYNTNSIISENAFLKTMWHFPNDRHWIIYPSIGYILAIMW